MVQLLLCGIPGTGKSTFSRWLVSNHGFAHLDVDHQTTQRTLDDWLREPLLVIDWGFPVSDLPTIKALVDGGIEHWWFDGDRDAALQVFLTRMEAGLHSATRADWDRQLAGIEARWQEIATIFDGRILDVVFAGPSLMPNEVRYQAISVARRPEAHETHGS